MEIIKKPYQLYSLRQKKKHPIFSLKRQLNNKVEDYLFNIIRNII